MKRRVEIIGVLKNLITSEPEFHGQIFLFENENGMWTYGVSAILAVSEIVFPESDIYISSEREFALLAALDRLKKNPGGSSSGLKNKRAVYADGLLREGDELESDEKCVGSALERECDRMIREVGEKAVFKRTALEKDQASLVRLGYILPDDLKKYLPKLSLGSFEEIQAEEDSIRKESEGVNENTSSTDENMSFGDDNISVAASGSMKPTSDDRLYLFSDRLPLFPLAVSEPGECL